MVYHFVRFMAAIPFPVVILVLSSLGICLAILTKDFLGFSRFTFIKIARKTPSFRAGMQSARQDLHGFGYRVNMDYPF